MIQNKLNFIVYSLDEKPLIMEFSSFKELTKYSGIKNATHFVEEGGVSPDGVIRLEAKDEFTNTFINKKYYVEKNSLKH